MIIERAAGAVAVLATCGAVAAAVIAVDPRFAKGGADVIEALRTGDTASIEARFDDTMHRALPHDRFVATMAQIRAQTGSLRSCGEAVARERAGVAALVEYRCEFEHAPMTLRLAWDADARISGLFVMPVPPAPTPATPLPPNVRDEAITTGAPGWPLPGTVLLPVSAGRGKPPIAVLVHGSGPNDRDETIGANRPFLDLAVGFVQRGIASVRYDKRTNALGARFVAEVKAPTLDDEIVDDAVAALVQAASRSDVGAVVVVGHSEGAWLAPRIAAGATRRGVKVAGVVMLAAPLTSFEDLIVDQYAFLAHLDPPGATQAMIDEMSRRRDNVRRLVRQGADAPDPASADELPLGLPASLWRDLAGYDPAAALLSQPSLPALLTFGGRDFQVPIREKALWEARLAGRTNATIVAFPRLNHLLIEGDGPMSTAEYGRAGHVSPALIDRVSTWILARGGAR